MFAVNLHFLCKNMNWAIYAIFGRKNLCICISQKIESFVHKRNISPANSGFVLHSTFNLPLIINLRVVSNTIQSKWSHGEFRPIFCFYRPRHLGWSWQQCSTAKSGVGSWRESGGGGSQSSIHMDYSTILSKKNVSSLYCTLVPIVLPLIKHFYDSL
jgi:hypothetical protein